MRAFIAFLLCLTVAFQGIANAHVSKQPCPMERGAHAVMLDASAAARDCCNDADKAAKTGEPCKTGQECNLSNACTVALLKAPTRVPASPDLVPTANLITPSFDPSGVWRPPTFS